MAPSPTGCPLAGGVEKSARASPGSIDRSTSATACRSGGGLSAPKGSAQAAEPRLSVRSAGQRRRIRARRIGATAPRATRNGRYGPLNYTTSEPSAPQCGISGASRPIAEWNAPAGGSCACRASADGGFALQTPPGLRPPPWDEPAKPASSDSEHSALSPASPTDAAGGDGGTATRVEPYAEPEPAASIEEGTSERRWRPHRCTRRHCVDGHVRLANTEVGQRMQQCLLAKPSQCRPS